MADARLKPVLAARSAIRARALARGEHGNPFAVLGPHDTRDGRIIRAFLPGATKVEVVRRSDGALLAPLEPANESGLFESLVHERDALSAADFLAGCRSGDRGPLFVRPAARRHRPSFVQRRPAFRIGRIASAPRA